MIESQINMTNSHESSSEGSAIGYRRHSSAMSCPTSEITTPGNVDQPLSSSMTTGLAELFSENTAAKIWRVAMDYIEHDVCFFLYIVFGMVAQAESVLGSQT